MTEAEERAKHYVFSPQRLKQLGALNRMARSYPELFMYDGKKLPIPEKYYVRKKKK